MKNRSWLLIVHGPDPVNRGGKVLIWVIVRTFSLQYQTSFKVAFMLLLSYSVSWCWRSSVSLSFCSNCVVKIVCVSFYLWWGFLWFTKLCFKNLIAIKLIQSEPFKRESEHQLQSLALMKYLVDQIRTQELQCRKRKGTHSELDRFFSQFKFTMMIYSRSS